MALAKPRIFIGSSSEARSVVQALVKALIAFSNPDPWYTSSAFTNMSSLAGELIRAANSYDFAIFVLSADDKLTTRKRNWLSIRDNVLFELGLFIGVLGDHRTLALVEEVDSQKKIKIPSDIEGLIIPRFSRDDEHRLNATISACTADLEPIIKKHGLRHYAFSLRAGWEFDPKTHVFVVDIDPVKFERHRSELNGQGLVLVLRKRDPTIAFETDRSISIGQVRRVSINDRQDMTLQAGKIGCLGRLASDDIIDAYLLLVPPDRKVDRCKTLEEMFELGCRILECPGQEVGPQEET